MADRKRIPIDFSREAASAPGTPAAEQARGRQRDLNAPRPTAPLVPELLAEAPPASTRTKQEPRRRLLTAGGDRAPGGRDAEPEFS